ncbi:MULTISPECIES: ParB/RepB/Spo0J family partition protein [unclassified Nocardiopsis]|uniref:ParB/RepB/Spo0J family partition protein n=1 Tax=unclassified Nocardiopsis TaxID=2649073 RepID=UPI00066D1F7E|nr:MULTISPECIES: ParB/RepB/Spo0J family partition protein [unclassified Nocardiopsis]MBQ1081774.1 ParB/RepB/Spo0J family partition protein [Nocardiopsis sp. B62]
MSQQRRGLGKGLGALIPQGPTAPAPVESVRDTMVSVPEPPAVQGPTEMPDGTYMEEVELTSITPNPRQPRTYFDDEALDELRDSIIEVGLLQPVVVRKLEGEGEPRYELIMGERRFRASKLAELERIPAIVRRTDDDELLREALLENLHRQQLNPLEEAAAYQQMLDDFGTTQGELAQQVGKSRSHIANTLRLLNLPGRVQTRVAAGVLSAGHARALLSIDDPEAQERLAKRVNDEGLSVRSLEEIVALREIPEEDKPRRASAGRIDNPPQIEEWATRMGDRLDTTVKVDIGRKKGKIVVEFATMEDLERIIGQMDREN